MKRNKSNESMGEALQRLMKQSNWGNKVQQAQIRSVWLRLMGSHVNSQTRNIFLQNGDTLVIQFYSAALRQEMMYSKDLIIKRMNEHLQAETIKSVILK